MTPEQKARQNIDQLLTAAGWTIQHREAMNLGASQGVAVREFQMASGPADYLLFIDRKAAGAIEAKPEGTTLGGVSEQTARYLTGIPANLPCHQSPLPFRYESTGVETFFRVLRTGFPLPPRFRFQQTGNLRAVDCTGAHLAAPSQRIAGVGCAWTAKLPNRSH